MQKDKKLNIVGKLLLLITTIIWGCSFFILKNTMDFIPPVMVIAIRFSISALILGLIFIKKLMKMKKTTLIKGAILGCAVACAYIIQTVGLNYTTPSKNAFLTATYCVIVPFMAWAFFKKKPKLINVISSLLCLAGIGFISLNNGFLLGVGDGLTLLGSIFFALQIVLISKFVAEEDTICLLVVQIFVCAIICWIVSLSAEYSIYPKTFPKETILPLLVLAIFATAMGQTFQIIGQKYTKPVEAGLIFSLEAVFGALFSALFFDERFTVGMYIGFALVFIALLLSVDYKKTPQIDK